jgi:hypothetical protein
VKSLDPKAITRGAKTTVRPRRAESGLSAALDQSLYTLQRTRAYGAAGESRERVDHPASIQIDGDVRVWVL